MNLKIIKTFAKMQRAISGRSKEEAVNNLLVFIPKLIKENTYTPDFALSYIKDQVDQVFLTKSELVVAEILAGSSEIEDEIEKGKGKEIDQKGYDRADRAVMSLLAALGED